MSDANYDVEGLYDGDEENCFDEALMEELWERRTEMTEMKAQIKQLTKERDEARRMYCSMVENNARQYGTSAQSVAKQAGWDCFKEEEMACDKVSQEVSQEGSKLPTTISSSGICITEYIPPQNSVREIPPYGAYTTGECTLSVHTIKKTQ